MKRLIGMIIALIITESEAFRTGAPSFACGSLMPLHAPSQATGPIPYEVVVSEIAAYVPDQSYESKSQTSLHCNS